METRHNLRVWLVGLLVLLLCGDAYGQYGEPFQSGPFYYEVVLKDTTTVALVGEPGIDGYYDISYASITDSVWTIPETVSWNGNSYRVAQIQGYAFMNNLNIRHMTIPGSVKVIYSAFERCNLQTLNLNEGVEHLVGFNGLDGVVHNMQLPSTLTSIIGTWQGKIQSPAFSQVYCVFWNSSFNDILSHNWLGHIERESNIYPQAELYVAMTRDDSKNCPNPYTEFVRGFSLWGADVKNFSGQNVVVPIELNRLDSITKLQCVVELPDGIKPIGEDGDNGIWLDEARSQGIDLSLDGNLLTIAGGLIPGIKGTLFNLRLPGGSYDVVLKDIVMTTVDNQTIYQSNDTIRVGSEKVDVTDVNNVINQMLGKGTVGTINVNGVAFDMVKVEGGTFSMGVEYDEDNQYYYTGNPSPVHQVTLSDFAIGKTEVTQELWNAVMGTTSMAYTLRMPRHAITWNQWQEFIAKLNEMTALQFRMPTEAEWEYAASGGRYSHGYKYSGSDDWTEVAWTTQLPSTTFGLGIMYVGLKKPNELGLYDMSGNVWEFVNDWYGDYPAEAQVDPQGPDSGTYKVIRGGDYWYSDYTAVKNRGLMEPNKVSSEKVSGLRLALPATTFGYSEENDYNHDNAVDIQDVNCVINAMLGRSQYDVPTGHQGHDTVPQLNK